MENRARIDLGHGGHPADAAAGAAEQKRDAQGLLRSLEDRLNEPHVDEAPPAQTGRTPKRLLKALAGVAIIAVFGWLPLQALWQTSSVEAVVNSRLVTLRAPIDGQVTSAASLNTSEGLSLIHI